MLPLNNNLLRYLSCLNPKHRAENDDCAAIIYISKKLHVYIENIPEVCNQWKMYQIDLEVPTNVSGWVDHYWRDVFKLQSSDKTLKYPLLTYVIKCALVLPHGNACVERSISVNGNVDTGTRNKLGENTINKCCSYH